MVDQASSSTGAMVAQPQELLTHDDAYTRQTGEEPFPGCVLIEPLGKGGFGEVWKCQVPGGLVKAIKFVHGNLNTLSVEGVKAEQELGALERIKNIRHPFLLSMERVEIVNGELMIVMELADKDLEQVLRDCQAAGMAGIPRVDLVPYLLEAAEALDLMNHQHGLQHLDIKPRNLFLVSNHVKVADFGLVNKQDDRGGGAIARQGGITPVYAAPEVQQGKISRHCDQYSLAIVYQELLTDTLPFEGKNSRQLMMQHITAKPNLDPLPADDREVVARALSKDPEQRFPSCLSFMRALAYAKDRLAHKNDANKTPAPIQLPPARQTLSGVYMHRRLPPVEVSPKNDADGKTLPSKVRSVADDPTQNSAPLGANSGPKRNYEFLKCIRRSPLGEVWKVRQTDGGERLAHFLPGFATSEQHAAAKLTACFREFRHPALASVEPWRDSTGQLVLVSECYDQTLANRSQQCRTEGLAGIPRPELLGYLTTVAKALDELAEKYGLSHLGLNPHTLALAGDQMVITEFGLVELVWLPTRQPASLANPQYAPPELSKKVGGSASDQYSLALIYAEMITGIHPRPARSRQRAGGADNAKLNLDMLPITDRNVVAQALHPDPNQRFRTCTEFMRALKDATVVSRSNDHTVRLPPVIPLETLFGEPTSPGIVLPKLDQLVAHQFASVHGRLEFRRHQQVQYSVAENGALEHRFPVRVFADSLRLKLDGFRQMWKVQVARQSEREVEYHLLAPRSSWQKVFGRAEGLKIRVSIPPAHGAEAILTEAVVNIAPIGGEPGVSLLAKMGPSILDSIRSFLQASPERRRQSRWACLQPLRVFAVYPSLEVAKPVTGMTKDLSCRGIGFTLPQPPATPHVFVHLQENPTWQPWVVHAQVVRIQPLETGWFEIGAAFCKNVQDDGVTKQ